MNFLFTRLTEPVSFETISFHIRKNPENPRGNLHLKPELYGQTNNFD